MFLQHWATCCWHSVGQTISAAGVSYHVLTTAEWDRVSMLIDFLYKVGNSRKSWKQQTQKAVTSQYNSKLQCIIHYNSHFVGNSASVRIELI